MKQYNAHFAGITPKHVAREIYDLLLPPVYLNSPADLPGDIHQATLQLAKPLIDDAKISMDLSRELTLQEANRTAFFKSMKAPSDDPVSNVLKTLAKIESQYISIPDILRQSSYPGDETR